LALGLLKGRVLYCWKKVWRQKWWVLVGFERIIAFSWIKIHQDKELFSWPFFPLILKLQFLFCFSDGRQGVFIPQCDNNYFVKYFFINFFFIYILTYQNKKKNVCKLVFPLLHIKFERKNFRPILFRNFKLHFFFIFIESIHRLTLCYSLPWNLVRLCVYVYKEREKWTVIIKLNMRLMNFNSNIWHHKRWEQKSKEREILIVIN
jgi:hypothetical protein